MHIRLRVLSGSSEGKEIQIKKERFLIGRHDECHLRPKTDSVSRRHCEIQYDGHRALCQDLGSKNGTYVNDQKLDGIVELHSGDLLRVGKMRFEVLISGTVPMADSDDSSRVVVDGDVSDWLEEADMIASQQRISEPETRQFRLEDIESLEAKKNAETQASEKTSAASSETQTDPKRLQRRTPSSSSDNSRDAAADVLKRYFNRT